MLKPDATATTSLDTEDDVATKRTVDEPSAIVTSLMLRGQMVLVDEWDLIIFLCTPVYGAFDLSFERPY